MPFQKGHKKIPGSGRPKGTPNVVAADIKAACLKLAPEMVEELRYLALNSKHEQTRVAAAREILDRGLGRPAQAFVGTDEGPVQVIHKISWMKEDRPDARPRPRMTSDADFEEYHPTH